MDTIGIKFSDLEENEKIFLCTNLHSVSATKNPDDETFEQIEKMQEFFLFLPIDIRKRMLSSETSNKVLEIGKLFNLQLLQMADVARLLRSYYFKETRLEDFPNILIREIPTDIDTAQKISKQVIEKIINNKSLGISEVDRKLIDASASQAIQQYPQLGEQLITSSPIKLKIFPQPVRPSIKNWIEDYRSMMGAQRHGMMERGNYVFHSENTKKLTAGDRKKLAEVLRSLDEDVALKVDPDRQEVVFEVFEEKKPVERMSNYQPESPAERFPVTNQVSSAQVSPRFGEASGIAYGRQNQNDKVFERPLPRRESVASQNVPNSAIQEKNRDNFFGNYQQKMEPTKPEMPKPSYQTPVQPSQNMGNNRNASYAVKTEQLKRSSTPIRPSLAGKSYEEINSDPKIRGNVVDLSG